MKKQAKNNILCFIPAVIIMIIIFLFSAQDSVESTEISGSLSYSLVSAVDKLFCLKLTLPIILEKAESIHNFVRKAGHFTEYMILGISLIIPSKKRFIKYKLTWIIVWIFCILYATSDEIHQYFVPGRYCSAKDVFIDSMGSLFGLLIVLMFSKIKLKHFSDNTI